MTRPSNRFGLAPAHVVALSFIGAASLLAESPLALPEVVKVARAPGRPWVEKKTRILAALPPIEADAGFSQFGGRLPATENPTGFFRVTQSKGRWWLVDPGGHRFIHRGVTSVRTLRSRGAQMSLEKRFGSNEAWATATCDLLREHGFNGLGAWCDEEALRPSSSNLAYTKLWNFMSSYGRQRGGTYQKSGHRGYPNDCPFIFDPEFAEFCRQHARKLAATKDDPWLLGHFTDNELPWSTDMLGKYLELPATDHGHRAARKWLEDRHGAEAGREDIRGSDRSDFLAHAADTYFSTVCRAIREQDPNHLILGARFHGRATKLPELFQAAGRHLDVLSVNYYHAWTPDPERLAVWATNSRKPVIITEWYAKAIDSKLGNTSGAGWLVNTQADRAAFYQNFTLGLMESKTCVGWHWFRYSDNDPEERGTDPSNSDANKGTVSNRYEPYTTLLNAMQEINTRTYGIIEHFDQAEPHEK